MSLIKEFAIEPRVMATWEHFNSMWEDFGAHQGRLISMYPVLWKTEVDKLARMQSKPVRAAAISAKIRRDNHKFLATGRDYYGKRSWLDNVLSHAATQPFEVVVAFENSAGHPGVLVAGEFAKDEPPYRVVVEDFFPRQAYVLADCAGLLLANCEEIQFIDPHFEASEPRFSNTFGAMLSLCRQTSLKTIEIHREKPKLFKPDVQEANFRHRLAAMVPTGSTLKIFFWSQMPGGMDLHPRFLLTDIAGIHYENGLDEGEPGKKTLVKPLTYEVWQQCRALYSATSGAFALTPDCIVTVRGQG